MNKFCLAEKQAKLDIMMCYPEIRLDKLENVKIRQLHVKSNPHGNAKIFGKEFRSFAYYDPNKHIIYYNPRLISSASKELVYEILIHELIHAISDHSISQQDESVIFKSGIKKQVFLKKGSKCVFRAVNEGLVQYLCNKILHKRSMTYKYEVIFVENLMEIIGEKIILQAFFNGQDEDFEKAIDNIIGRDYFFQASNKLDQKKYTQAFYLFAQPKKSRHSDEILYLPVNANIS